MYSYRFMLLIYIWSMLLTVVHKYMHVLYAMSLTLRLKPIIHIWWRDKRKLRRYNVRFTYDRIHCMCVRTLPTYFSRVMRNVVGPIFFLRRLILSGILLDIYQIHLQIHFIRIKHPDCNMYCKTYDLLGIIAKI